MGTHTPHPGRADHHCRIRAYIVSREFLFETRKQPKNLGNAILSPEYTLTCIASTFNLRLQVWNINRLFHVAIKITFKPLV